MWLGHENEADGIFLHHQADQVWIAADPIDLVDERQFVVVSGVKGENRQLLVVTHQGTRRDFWVIDDDVETQFVNIDLAGIELV